MATDLSLFVFDSGAGAIVCDRWLGGGATLEQAQLVLSRPPHAVRQGLECWTNVQPTEVSRIAEASYSGGAMPDEIAVLAERFSDARYVWTIVRDF